MANPSILRAWWWIRQGLDGSLRGRTAAEVLARSGWARSVGGVGPYLTLFSRARIARADADAAVAALRIYELPAARGCTYVLPAADYALGLALGDEVGSGDMAAARKLGVTDAEIEKLSKAILDALARGVLSPDELREATGKASRSLGEEGKKKGMTTTLPLALGELQASGAIRRVPVNGRLDQQRYNYTRWSPNPRAGLSLDAVDLHTELARRYFTWIGPVTLKEFQWFSGLGVKVANNALAPLKLVAAAGFPDRLLLPEQADAFAGFKVPKAPAYALVSSLDSIAAARRDATSLFDEDDLDRLHAADKKRAGGMISDLPHHAILDRGRVIGLWEYDSQAGKIVSALFGRKPDAQLKAEIAETEAFVRDQLGDARSFSLDSPASRVPRIAALKRLQ